MAYFIQLPDVMSLLKSTCIKKSVYQKVNVVCIIRLSL